MKPRAGSGGRGVRRERQVHLIVSCTTPMRSQLTLAPAGVVKQYRKQRKRHDVSEEHGEVIPNTKTAPMRDCTAHTAVYMRAHELWPVNAAIPE